MEFESGLLPLPIPAEQAPGGLPPIDVSTPEGQGIPRERVLHVLWKIADGVLSQAVVVGLEQGDTIQAAVSRDGRPVDLAKRALIALPMWAFDADGCEVIRRKLPIV